MAEIWPIALPQCLALPFTEALGDNLDEYTPDVGPPISRRRSTSASRPLSGTMRMTFAELTVMRNFFEVTLDQGALAFTFPNPSGAGDLLVKFAKGDQPSWQRMGTVYRVSLRFTVLP